MENALHIGLSRQMVLRQAMDVTANNLANLSTAGFKLETLHYETHSERPASHRDGPRGISFVRADAVLRDFSQGPIEATGRPLDLAIEGEGFFAVRAQGADRYTRDGRFSLDPEGRLVTASGASVLDEAGGEIAIDVARGAPRIAADGSIFQGEAEVGRIGVVRFADRGGLEKLGDGLYRAAGPAEPAEAATLRQGAVEGSNVKPIVEITKMIETARAYESVTRMLQNEEDLRKRAIERLGRAS